MGYGERGKNAHAQTHTHTPCFAIKFRLEKKPQQALFFSGHPLRELQLGNLAFVVVGGGGGEEGSTIFPRLLGKKPWGDDTKQAGVYVLWGRFFLCSIWSGASPDIADAISFVLKYFEHPCFLFPFFPSGLPHPLDSLTFFSLLKS